MRDKWNSFQVDGWGGFVLREKLKMTKLALKDWHEYHTENMPSRINTLKVQLSTFDSNGETEMLSDDEIWELNGII
jgi:hypothetical protein